jgi:hypothetical protein
MRWIGKIFLGLLAITAIGFGLSYATMALWNHLMPAIFGLTVITFWQAFGLLVLSKILFSGFHKGGGCWGGRCGRGGHWGHHRGGYWRKRWENKMANMTPEEREKFKAGMSKCGWYGGGEDWCETEKKDTPAV